MIKIGHIVDELGIGGLERTTVAIVLNLKGYTHEVLCLRKKGVLAQEIQIQGIKIREFNFEGGLKFSSIIKLIKELKNGNFHIVHCHGLYPSIWGRIAAIFARVKIRIIHCQNLYYGILIRDRIKLWFLSLFTTKVIAVSEAVKKSLVEFIWINPKKISVIYNSASEIKLQSSYRKKELRENFGIEDNDFVIGNIGRLTWHKGHFYLLEAFANCKSQVANCKCIIVGDGFEMNKLKQEAENLKLKDSIIFTGFRSDIENILSIMDVFVLPSTLTEGLPLVLAEAASAGLPLIATSVGGNTEIVFNGVNGFIVKPRDISALTDKIIYLINNPIDREKMGNESKKIWNRYFTLGKMLEKIDNLYKNYVSM